MRRKKNSAEKGNDSSVTKQLIVSTQDVSAGNINETVFLFVLFSGCCFIFCFGEGGEGGWSVFLVFLTKAFCVETLNCLVSVSQVNAVSLFFLAVIHKRQCIGLVRVCG